MMRKLVTGKDKADVTPFSLSYIRGVSMRAK